MSIEELTFSPEERLTYEEIYANAKRDFGDLDGTGTATRNIAQMFGEQPELCQLGATYLICTLLGTLSSTYEVCGIIVL